MKATEVSRTAQYIALFRAIETRQPKSKRLFEDQLAISFLDPGLKLVAMLSSFPVIGNRLIEIVQKLSHGALSMGIARTKYIDDLTIQAVKEGAKQVIILGAGFDTRGSRLKELEDIPVIEIDHHNTSKFKLDVFKKINYTPPQNIQYLQIDFNKQNIIDFATEKNINYTIPTVIIWEGVSSYLDEPAINLTFEFFKKFAPGTFVIFTYLHRLALDNPQAFEGAEKMTKLLNQKEENGLSAFIRNNYPII